MAISLTLVALIVVAIMLVAGWLLPVEFSIGGPLYPLAEGRTYMFEGRPRSIDPPVVIFVTLLGDEEGRWNRAKVEVNNFLRYAVHLSIDIYIYGKATASNGYEREVIAEGHASLTVKANNGGRPGSAKTVVELTWAEGSSARDAFMGELEARAWGRPGPFSGAPSLSPVSSFSRDTLSLRKIRAMAATVSA